MKYLLDTNIVIAFNQGNRDLLAKMRQYSVHDFVLSNIVLFKLAFGAYNSQKINENLRRLEKLQFPLLPFTQNDALSAGKVRADLQRQGKLIGAYDMLIAGQAIAQDLILITHNIKEFQRVDGLKWEDWLA